jgi:hypothetical protein
MLESRYFLLRISELFGGMAAIVIGNILFLAIAKTAASEAEFLIMVTLSVFMVVWGFNKVAPYIDEALAYAYTEITERVNKIRYKIKK